MHGRKGEAYDECGSLSFSRTFRPDRATVKPDKLLHNGESEAKAAMIPGKRRISLPETVKNVRQELRLDSHSRILYGYFEL
jgi:hypothetical protein